MHEFSIAQGIIDYIKNYRNSNNVKVKKVVIKAGIMQQIIPDSLIFFLNILKKENNLEETSFEIRESPVKVRCRECGAISIKNEINIICDKCKSYNTELLEGDELVIESLEVEE